MIVDEDAWHGWSVNGVAYHVGRLPGRTRVQLYRVEGGTLMNVAGFHTPEEAAEFLEWLDGLATSGPALKNDG